MNALLSPFEKLADKEELVILKDQLENRLDDDERAILMFRFGFDDGTPKTLKSVAETFGITRERIRQKEQKALRKLRHPSSLSDIELMNLSPSTQIEVSIPEIKKRESRPKVTHREGISRPKYTIPPQFEYHPPTPAAVWHSKPTPKAA